MAQEAENKQKENLDFRENNINCNSDEENNSTNWKCKSCTFSNSLNVTQCEMCNNINQQRVPLLPSAPQLSLFSVFSPKKALNINWGSGYPALEKSMKSNEFHHKSMTIERLLSTVPCDICNKQVSFSQYNTHRVSHEKDEKDLINEQKNEYEYILCKEAECNQQILQSEYDSHKLMHKLSKQLSVKHSKEATIVIIPCDYPKCNLEIASNEYASHIAAHKLESKPLSPIFNGGLGNYNNHYGNLRGYLKITINDAMQLKGRGSYCTVKVSDSNSMLSTRKVDRNEHPEWRQTLTFKNFRPDNNKKAIITVYDKSTILKDKIIGSTQFLLPKYFNVVQNNTLELKNKKKLSGLIAVRTVVVPNFSQYGY